MLEVAFPVWIEPLELNGAPPLALQVKKKKILESKSYANILCRISDGNWDQEPESGVWLMEVRSWAHNKFHLHLS